MSNHVLYSIAFWEMLTKPQMGYMYFRKKNPQISFVSIFDKSQTAETLLINSLPESVVRIFFIAT